ncbi:MAG: AAA family ATPase [Candidatus Thermoplasmatota archaeon]
MTVTLLAGMPGAGKEEFLRVAKKYGFEIVRMGDVVRSKAEKRSEKRKERESVGEFANKEREEHHEGIWADRTLSHVTEDRTVIDGIRSQIEVSIFKSKLDRDAKTVAIHASPKTRFERLKKRSREDAPQSWSEFNDRDDRELEWGLGRVIAKADHMIVNEGSLNDYHESVREILDELSPQEL